MIRCLFLTLILASSALAAPPMPAPMESPPPLGITAPVLVTDIIDGDTVEVEIRTKMRVRLLSVWAPEMRGGTADSRHAAQKSRQHLIALADGQPGILFVPATGAKQLGDIFTLNRVLGELWVYGENMGAVQIKDGHASSTKDGKLGE